MKLHGYMVIQSTVCLDVFFGLAVYLDMNSLLTRLVGINIATAAQLMIYAHE